MNRLGILFLAGVVLISAGCMKKRVSKFGNQSMITDPSTPTPECPAGANFSIRPLAEGHLRDDEGYLVFRTGSPVFFSISASGCSAGFEVVVNGAGRFFRNETTTAITFSTPSSVPINANFVINILRDTPTGKQVARDFQIQSSSDHPFKVVSSPEPMCDVWPNPVYLNERKVAKLDWTPAVAGKLKSITAVTDTEVAEAERLTLGVVYPAIPAAGLSVSPNTPKKFEISTNGKAGLIKFEYEAPNNSNVVNSARSTGACTVEVIAGGCGGSYRGNFLGLSDRSKQNIQLSCPQNEIWFTDADGTQSRLASFNFNQNPIKRTLIGQLIQADPREGLLLYKQAAGVGKFYRALVQDLGDGSYTFGQQLNQECGGAWTLPAGATNGLPESFMLIRATATEKAKISALQVIGGQSYLYEADLNIALDNSSCVVENLRQTEKTVKIAADSNLVNFNSTTTVRWEATLNDTGYSCSVSTKLVSAEDAAYQAVSGHSNRNGQNRYSNQSFQTVPIDDDRIYRLICEKSGATSLEQTVIVNVNPNSVPLQIRTSSGTGTPPTRYVNPNLAPGAYVSELTATPVYVRYNVPSGTSSCRVSTEPAGGTATSVSVSGQGELNPSIDRTTSFRLSCDQGLSTPISRNVSMGGLPDVKPGTFNTISIPAADPNTSTDRDIVVQASRNRTKIKIKNATISNVSGSNWTVDTACDGQELNADGSNECVVGVRYTAGGHSTSAVAKLVITYQRYNADGVLEPTEYTHAIASLQGAVKPAPPRRRRGK